MIDDGHQVIGREPPTVAPPNRATSGRLVDHVPAAPHKPRNGPVYVLGDPLAEHIVGVGHAEPGGVGHMGQAGQGIVGVGPGHPTTGLGREVPGMVVPK